MKKLLVLLFTICAFSQLMAQATWGTPTEISTSGETASDPRVVIDSSGNVTAVWVQNSTVAASSLPAGMSWTSPATLSSGTASSPRLGIDSTGNVTAIWVDGGVVSTATLTAGSTMWSSESAISQSGASSPSLAVDSAGNAVAVWVRGGVIESSTRQLFTGTWSIVSQLTANTSSSSPSVAIGADGTVVAVWCSVVTGSDVVISSVSSISSETWGTAFNIIGVTSSASHNFPKVVVDQDGNATAIWLRYTLDDSIYQDITIISASLPVGNSAWTAIPTIITTGGETINIANISTKLAVDTNGNVLAVWSMSYDGSIYNVESAQKPFGGNWSLVTALQDAILYPYQVDLAANNALGDALVAYMVFDGMTYVIIEAQEANISTPEGAIWSTMQTLSTANTNNGFARVASASTGTALSTAAVWIQYDSVGMSNVIAAATGTDTLINPPTSPSVVQSTNNFNVFTEYYNTISWTESTSPNLEKCNVYRNGVYFDSTDPLSPQIIDHNASNTATVTYSINVEDLNGNVSPSAVIVFTP